MTPRTSGTQGRDEAVLQKNYKYRQTGFNRNCYTILYVDATLKSRRFCAQWHGVWGEKQKKRMNLPVVIFHKIQYNVKKFSTPNGDVISGGGWYST